MHVSFRAFEVWRIGLRGTESADSEQNWLLISRKIEKYHDSEIIIETPLTPSQPQVSLTTQAASSDSTPFALLTRYFNSVKAVKQVRKCGNEDQKGKWMSDEERNSLIDFHSHGQNNWFIKKLCRACSPCRKSASRLTWSADKVWHSTTESIRCAKHSLP